MKTQTTPKKVVRELKSKESLSDMYDFDIVESEPDSFDENDDPSVPLKKKGPGSKRRMSQTEKAYMQAGLDKPSAENHEAEQKVELSPEKAKLMAEEAKKAEKEILETEVGFWELVNCLDTQLISLFGKSLVAFYLLVVFCVFLHVVVTYFINKDLWFKYFPPGDDPAKQSSGQGNFGPRLDL